MSSSRTIPLYTFVNYLGSGDRSYLPEKNTEFYKIEEFAKIEIAIHHNIKELKDFNFDGGVEFRWCHFQQGLKFTNYRGKGGIKFTDCTAPGFDSKDPSPSLVFQNFIFDHLVIENCNLAAGIFFTQLETKQEPNLLSSLKISNSTFNEGGISLNNIKFKHGFEFISIKKCGPIKLKDLETTKQCSFTLVTADSLKVSGEKLKMGGDLKFTRSTFPIAIFEKAQIGGDLKLYEPQIKGQFSIFGSTISGRTLITSYPEVPYQINQKTSFETCLPSIFIHTTDFVDGFALEGKDKASNSISLDFSPLLKGRLEFRNVNINNLEMKGTNSESTVFFRNVGLGKVSFIDFINLKSISFSKLNPGYTKSQNAVFSIQYSDLGNWELANFDFDSFDQVKWKDSQITGLRTSAVSWFKENKLIADGEDDPSTCFRRREFYLQLKQSAQKQGDRINELEFKRREIKAYRKGLKIRKENQWDRFTIWTGGSNNHGQSWGKALGLIIAFTLVIFYPLIISCVDPELTFWPINSTWKGFGFFWDKYKQYSDSIPELFNPTHRTDILFKDPTNLGWLRFWDGFHRIILAFFIFQIVSAFRKFVK